MAFQGGAFQRLAFQIRKKLPSAGGGRGLRRQKPLEWQPWPVFDDEDARKAKRKRNELLLLIH